MCKIGHATVFSTVWQIRVFHRQTGSDGSGVRNVYCAANTSFRENEVNFRIETKTILSLSRRGKKKILSVHIYIYKKLL